MKKQKLLKRCTLLMAYFFCTALLMAQSIRVTGTVTDEKSEPIIGAAISVKGTTTGVITDFDGKFSLDVPGEGSVLEFSYISYEKQEIRVSSRRVFDVKLREDQQMLDEVVVVGYGTQKRANLTGAVGTVNSEELTSRIMPNTSSLLQGRVPGLQITQNSGQPGNESNDIQIRGMGTFSSAGSEPLVLIDGVEGDMNKLNPNVIESVSVLKDAASAAIYGSRAANGVILITTKNGKEGRLNIDFNYNFSLQSPSMKQDRITNSVEFMELMNKAIAHTKDGLGTKDYTQEQIEAYRQGAISNPKQYPVGNDWIDDVTRTAPMHQYFLSVNGGKDGTTYNFGAGALNQKGTMIETGYKKYDVQFNLKTNLGGRVTFGTNIMFSTSDRYEPAVTSGTPPEAILKFNSTEDQMLCAYAQSPLFEPYLPDGSGRFAAYAYPSKGGNKNPVAIAKNGNQKKFKEYYVLASAFANVKILEGFNAEVKGSVKYQDTQGKALTVSTLGYDYHPNADGEYAQVSTWNSTANQLSVRNEKEVQYTLFATLNYMATFNNDHNVSAMAGYNQEYFRYDKLIGYRVGMPTSDMWELDTSPSAGQLNVGNAYDWALQSLFGRVNYDYQGKYLLEANIRYDGTSRLRSGNRWGAFPSFSAGWRASEESFMKNIEWLSNLKLRASWGQLGNQNIGNYPYQDLLATNDYNFNGVLEQGIYKKALNVPDIKWETTTATDIGLDFGVFNSRLYGSVDWYKKVTKDILRQLQVPDHIGLTGPWVNDGEMENSGWEFVLGHQNKIGDFRYGINANLETYKNKLLKYGAREIGTGVIKEEGLPWNTFYLYVFDGIYQNQEEIENGPKPITGTQPGDMKYKDISGPDGVPDGKIDGYDRTTVDGAFPKFNYGFNINMEYKGFDLTLFFQGVHGRKIYVKEWGIAPFRQSSPPPVFWRDAWDGEGTSNTIPHIFNENYAPNTQQSTWWLQSASYLRLKNLQFGYTIPANLTTRYGVQNLRVFFSGDNLLTFTDFFQGLDPERTASSNARAAIYPQNRVLTFGIKVTL